MIQQPENKRKTPLMTEGAGHNFVRYLRDYEYAEEMKCRCGYVIWPCWTEKEVEDAIISISGKLKRCPKSKNNK